MQYSVEAAKTNLLELIEAAERNEEVIIAHKNKPAVRLTPVTKQGVKFGLLAKLQGTDPDWFAPLSEDELRLWEGRGDEKR